MSFSSLNMHRGILHFLDLALSFVHVCELKDNHHPLSTILKWVEICHQNLNMANKDF